MVAVPICFRGCRRSVFHWAFSIATFVGIAAVTTGFLCWTGDGVWTHLHSFGVACHGHICLPTVSLSHQLGDGRSGTCRRTRGLFFFHRHDPKDCLLGWLLSWVVTDIGLIRHQFFRSIILQVMQLVPAFSVCSTDSHRFIGRALCLRMCRLQR